LKDFDNRPRDRLIGPVGAARHREAGKAFDRFEREAAEFHRRVALGYRELSTGLPGVLRIDASARADAVHRRVLEGLAARFPETFPSNGFT
jgi:thymidylate kinase